MATGSNVKTRLHNTFANWMSDLTDTLIVQYINQAIRDGWPHFKNYKRSESAATLAASTYIYSLSAITDLPEWGVSRVFVVSPQDEPAIRLQTVAQFEDNGTWKLRVPADLVNAFRGKALHVEYQAPHAAISAIGDTVPIDQDYVYMHCAAQFAERMMGKGHSASVEFFDRVLYGSGRTPGYLERAEERKIRQADAAITLPLYQPPTRTRGRQLFPLMGE